jgi:hypothetical protein
MKRGKPPHLPARFWLIGILAGTYFIVFSQDFKVLLEPLLPLAALTQSVSPWLYLVVGVSIFSCAMIRTWGRAGLRR